MSHINKQFRDINKQDRDFQIIIDFDSTKIQIESNRIDEKSS